MSVAIGDKADELWGLIWCRPEVDPDALAGALVKALGADEPDFRTRLLIRDSADALERYWGTDRWMAYLRDGADRECLEEIREEDLGPPKFHFDGARIRRATTPRMIEDYLRDLGASMPRGSRFKIGGRSALILAERLSRAARRVVVVVDDLDAGLGDRSLIGPLKKRHLLELRRQAPGDLPSGWPARIRSLGEFGNLQVDVLDPWDVLVGDLFSGRADDLVDLRLVKPAIDQDDFAEWVSSTSAGLQRDEAKRADAERKWYILYGDPLLPPSSTTEATPDT